MAKKSSRGITKTIIVPYLLALSAITGYIRGTSIRQARAEKSGTSLTTTLTNLDKSQQGPALLSKHYQHIDLPPAETKTPSVLANTNSVLENSVSNQLYRTLQPFVPRGTSTNKLWLYTSVLQNLSTDTNNVCSATNMPSTNFFHFVQMVEKIPTNELSHVIADTNTLFNFDAVRKAFQQPTNTFNFAQTTFEQGARYNLFKRMLTILPKHEGNTDFLYWDSAVNVVTNNGIVSTNYLYHPTVGVGLNLDAHPTLLSMLRFKNSDKIQEIIEPDPLKRSKGKYIKFTKAQLNLLTAHVRQNHHGWGAKKFQTEYDLSIHPDDMAKLTDYYHHFLASKIQHAENALKAVAPTNFADGSVLFGSYTHPLEVETAAVPVDIAYNCGSLTSWTNFKNGYANRDWTQAIQECIPASKTPKDRCNWRQKVMRKQKAKQLAFEQWKQQQQAKKV